MSATAVISAEGPVAFVPLMWYHRQAVKFEIRRHMSGSSFHIIFCSGIFRFQSFSFVHRSVAEKWKSSEIPVFTQKCTNQHSKLLMTYEPVFISVFIRSKLFSDTRGFSIIYLKITQFYPQISVNPNIDSYVNLIVTRRSQVRLLPIKTAPFLLLLRFFPDSMPM